MAGKKKDRTTQKNPPLPEEESDGDTTPTKDNRTDTENESDPDNIDSDYSDNVSGSLVQDIQSATGVLNGDTLPNEITNPHSA